MATRRPFSLTGAIETQFARALRKIAKVSGHIVEAHVDANGLHDQVGMQRELQNYSRVIGPWAARQSAKMLERVSKSNLKSFKAKGKAMLKESEQIAHGLKLVMAQEDVGRVASRLLFEQVELIKSLPIRAGLRAQKLAQNAVLTGGRASEVAQAIQELKGAEDVSESDAMRIARTEVARANASLTQARAQAVGSKGYIWRTTLDGAERKSHKEMNGKYIPYDKPPHLSDGTTGHAGTLINCRCWQDVQFDEE